MPDHSFFQAIQTIFSGVFIYVFLCCNLNAQVFSCGADTYEETLVYRGEIYGDTSYDHLISLQELQKSQELYSSYMTDESIIIPVVVHVIYSGGLPVNYGSNISIQRIYDAINNVNDAFLNSGIQFCLAKRDPDGLTTNGIVRFDASGLCYDGECIETGMSVGGPLDFSVKNSSIWPNLDYLNLWIVDKIIGDATGYATFPYAISEFNDGIVMEDDRFGLYGDEDLIHQLGHWLGLFHTYEGDCSTYICPDNCENLVCPPSNPLLGDGIADTPPHKRTCGECNITGANECDNFSDPELYVYNYMNDSDESCKSEFTLGQTAAMRMVINNERNTIARSLGCVQPCSNDDQITFDLGGDTTIVYVEELASYTIEEPINATNFDWYIDGVSTEYSGMLFQTYFDTPGYHSICVEAYDNNVNCTTRKCRIIEVRNSKLCGPYEDNCGFFNLGLENNNIENENIENIGNITLYDEGRGRVCQWIAKSSTPRLCSQGDEINHISLAAWGTKRFTDEAVVTLTEIDYDSKCSYLLRFEYLEINIKPYSTSEEDIKNTLHFGFTESIEEMQFPFDENYLELGTIQQSTYDISEEYQYCSNDEFKEYEIFLPDLTNEPKHLFFSFNLNLETTYVTAMMIRNIEIICCCPEDDLCPEEFECTPEPSFEYSIDECEVNFTASNSGDDAQYYWTFSDGTESYEDHPNVDFLYSDEFEVCLYATCGQDPISKTVSYCEMIYIPDEMECDDCQSLETSSLRCDTSSIGNENSFIGNITIPVEKGVAFCMENPIIDSEVNIEIIDFFIQENDNKDYISLSYSISDEEIAGKQGVIGNLILCDLNGEKSCYEIDFKLNSCENCHDEIFVTALCKEEYSTDSVFHYVAETKIDLPENGNFEYCGSSSTEAGYSIDVRIDNENSEAMVTYDVMARDEAYFTMDVTICFIDNIDNKRHCFILKIDNQPCVNGPMECDKKWNTKPIFCSQAGDGLIKYTFKMADIPADDFQYCFEGLSAEIYDTLGYEIEKGNTVINSYGQNRKYFSFDVDLYVPCDYEDQIILLRLYFCDEDENSLCYLFPLALQSCSIPCGEKGVNNRSQIPDITKNARFFVYPNPTTSTVSIDLYELDDSTQYTIEIIDQLGIKVFEKILKEDKFLLDEVLPNGIYFIKLMDDKSNLLQVEKVFVY